MGHGCGVWADFDTHLSDMPTVQINGATLAYSEVGPSDGPLVITLHGGRGQGSKEGDFRVYLGLFEKYGKYHVVSFDFRGHGHSSDTPPYTFKQIVDDVEALRRHFTEEKAIIIGGLFGSFLAQQYAITYPDSLSHLVLRGAAPSYHHEAGAFAKLDEQLRAPNSKLGKTVTKQMLEKVFGSFASDLEFRLAMFALGPLYSENYDANVGLERNLATRFNAESHNSLYSETEKYFDFTKDLPNVKVPTLIVVGEKDWICPKDQSELIARLVPNSKLVVVEGANHGVHAERKELVLSEIEEFIRRHP